MVHGVLVNVTYRVHDIIIHKVYYQCIMIMTVLLL